MSDLSDLQDRAKELDVQGRSKLDEEELREAVAAAEAAERSKRVPTYTRAEWGEVAGALRHVSHPSFVVAGALADAKGDTFTVAEVNKAVDAFLAQPASEAKNDDEE